ncbi:hypothetical protein [Mycobacterium vicinigordonae]|uniref:hypothetical protein n=1 Tax=Mycobacterium vicinigordonae TaxID=1719132 RepID=UPI001FED250F|nr:hypothetical protein [Mycobacterium vicinigordonae]
MAQADNSGYAINGTYVATSDGAFATTDYAFHDEATVTSTWTITSTCPAAGHCSGLVSSDQGWSAPLRMEGNVWYVERDIPNWETCLDGSTLAGHQTFMFYPANTNGVTQIGSPYLEGRDKTVGVRAACGIPPVADAPASGSYGKPLTIVMPFRLDKIR